MSDNTIPHAPHEENQLIAERREKLKAEQKVIEMLESMSDADLARAMRNLERATARVDGEGRR